MDERAGEAGQPGLSVRHGTPSNRRIPRTVVLLAAVVIACGPLATPPPASSPEISAAPTQSSATPAPTVAPGSTPGPWLTMRWRQVEVSSGEAPVSLAGLVMTGVAGGPRGGITIVYAEEDGSSASALVRLGDAWTQVPLVGWPRGMALEALVARPTGYLAFLGATTFETGARVVRALISPDGIVWREAGALGRMETIRHAAARGDRIVACGAPAADASQPACEVSSDDGATWRPSALPSAIREIDGVIVFGDGFLATATDTAGRLRTLLSADGLSWTMSDPDPTISAGGWVTSLLGHGGVAILAGRVPSDRHTDAGAAALFASRDGRTWERVAIPATDAEGFGLVDLGSKVLAVGRLSTGFEIRDVALLTSSDGLRWRLEPKVDWADAVDTRYAVASGMALVRAAIGSDCATQEIRLYTGTAVTTADAGAAPEPPPTPAPDPVGAPAPPAFTSVGSVPGAVRSAAFGADGFVAVGSGSDGASAAVWTSDDGRRWIGGPAVASGEREAVAVVASWRGGYVAGGAACPGSCDETGTEARFWYRTASGAWQQAPRRSDHSLGTRDLEGPDLGVRAIVESADGLIALAVSRTGGVVFRSTDGITWRRVAALDLAPFAAVAWRGGVIAAGGNAYLTDDRQRAAIWYSPDGTAWPAATMLESAAITGVAASGDRVVAVTYGPAAFASTDGRAWTWAPDQSTLTWGSMDAVLGGRDGFLALGRDPCPAGSACLTAWRSIDGLAWSRSVIEWNGPDDVAGPVAGYVLAGGRGEALAVVPLTTPYPAGDTATEIFALPWAP